jgi:hypothetical protein
MSVHPLVRPAKRLLIVVASIFLFGAAPYFAHGNQPTAAERGRSSTAPASNARASETASTPRPKIEPACRAVRRRLWVAAEGWIVRTVQICY